MAEKKKSIYWQRLLGALFWRSRKPTHKLRPAIDANTEARTAGLELELREREEQISRMRAEYEQLQRACQRAASEGGQSELERVFRKVAGPWATLLATASLAESGRAVPPQDLARLVRDVQTVLASAGLETIGQAGERTFFSITDHQRMSGGSVAAGTPVTVRIPGMRFGNKVLAKAMVSTRET